MKTAGLLLLAMILNTSSLSADTGSDDFHEGTRVVKATMRNFSSLLMAQKHLLLQIYHPEFKSSKAFWPQFVKLAERVQDNIKDITVAALNVLTDGDLAKSLGAADLPAFKLFADGKFIDYAGPLDAGRLFLWTQKQVSPVSEIAKKAELTKAERNPVACFLFLDKEHGDMLSEFAKASKEFLDIPFYYIYNRDLRNSYKMEHKISLVVWRNFDDLQKVLGSDKGFDQAAISNFVKLMKDPFIKKLDEETTKGFWERGASLLVLFTDDPESEKAELLYKVARKIEDLNLQFGQSPLSTPFGKQLAQFFGVAGAGQEVIRVVRFDGAKVHKYKLDQLTESTIDGFLKDFKKNSLSPYYKSQEAPAADDGPVKTVVGKNFDSIVLSKAKDVVLWAWAPWSDKCKGFEPVFAQLAQRFAGVKTLVFAKINGAENEHPSLALNGFPTIQLYKAGEDKQPVTMSKEPTFQSVVSFLQEQLGKDFAEGNDARADQDL